MYNKSQAKRYGWVKKSYVCNIQKNEISVICVTNIARGKNVWHKNIIISRRIDGGKNCSGIN